MMTVVEHSFTDAHASLPADCPFTFLYLSSEDSTRDDPSRDAEQATLDQMLHQLGRELHTFLSLLMKFSEALAMFVGSG